MTCMTFYCCYLLSSSFFIVQAILRLFCVTEEKISSVRCMVCCLGKCISGSKGKGCWERPSLRPDSFIFMQFWRSPFCEILDSPMKYMDF